MPVFLQSIILMVTLTLVSSSFYSCAHMKSGYYVQLKKGETIEKLAKENKISLSQLKLHNKGKNFSTGEWVFIPTNQGIVPQLAKKYSLFSSYTAAYLKGSLLWPVPSYTIVSSDFGEREGRPHQGIDVPAPPGTEIVAAEEGEVIISGSEEKGYGNLVMIAHAGNIYTLYAHNRKNLVRKGEKVSRGQVIAEVGNTGRSTGPHLHFEIREDNIAVNPTQYFETTITYK